MLPKEIESDSKWSSPTALYRYFTPDGVLLYIGISSQPHERNRAHCQKAEWFKYASHRSVEWFPSRALAEWAEDAVIASEEPDFNTKRQAPRPFNRVADAWFLDEVGGKPTGLYLSWFTRPEGNALGWRGDMVECPAPRW